MPTIEVGDADMVFIVRREGPPWRTATPQVVELGPNDMVVTVQRGDNHEPLLHGTRVYVNGSQIRFVQEFRIEVSTEESHVPVLDFAILSPDAEGISDGMRRRNEISLNNLMRLLPEATIREIGFNGVLVREHGALHETSELAYEGPRPTRFERVLKELG